MTAIRNETTINSDTLHLPQLKPLVGKNVEIVVREVPERLGQSGAGSPVNSLAGSVLAYVEPFARALSPDDWEANH